MPSLRPSFIGTVWLSATTLTLVLVGAAHAQTPTATPQTAPASPAEFSKDMGMGAAATVRLRDAVNWPDCTKGEKSYTKCDKKVKCHGVRSPAFGWTFREPVVISEVSCRPNESLLLKESPTGRALAKAVYGAMKAPSDGQKCMETNAKEGHFQYYFEAHAFGITPWARVESSLSNSKDRNAYITSGSAICDGLILGSKFLNLIGMDLDQASAFSDTFNQIGNVYKSADLGGLTGTSLLNGVNGFDMLAAGSAQGAASELVGGTLGNALSPVTNALNSAVSGLTSAFSGSGGKDVGSTGTVSSAASGAGEGLSTVELAADRVAAFSSNPLGLAMGQLGRYLPMGLIPIYISEFVPMWKTGNPADFVASGQSMLSNAMAGSAAGQAACGSQTLLNDFSSFSPQLSSSFESLTNSSILSAANPCIGFWGRKAPITGFVRDNKNRPVAGAIVGYRSFLEVGKTSKDYKNVRGVPKFEMSYPYINTGIMNGFMKSISPFAKGNHGQKGTGCYNPGTMDPRWYTIGENLIPDPSQQLQESIESTFKAATTFGPAKNNNNGDFVFTYWANKRCCFPVFCPNKVFKE